VKYSKYHIALILIIGTIVFSGCSNPHLLEPPAPGFSDGDISSVSEANSSNEVIIENILSETPEANTSETRLSIKSDIHLQEIVSELHKAYFQGEMPLFVEKEPDLIATRAATFNDSRPVLNATFLPGEVLLPQTNNQNVIDFIQFAISPEGQKVLIELGALPESITISDQKGKKIEILQPVQRVISAYGPTTAMIYSINAGDRLVAASYLGARDPQGAEAMERIDPRFTELVSDDFFSQQEFNLEHAAVLAPDLIIGAMRSTWEDSVEQLGIPILLIEAENSQQLREVMLLLGKIFGPHSYAQAQAWVEYFDWTLETIQGQLEAVHIEDKPRVLFTGTQSLRVASGEMYQTTIIETAGGVSVSRDLFGYWNDVNLEQVAVWNPDIIIVPPYGGASVDAIIENPEWNIVLAAEKGRVYRMPKLVVPWDTPTPDSVLGIIWMAEIVHPELIDLRCANETEYFYKTFYNYALSKDEAINICSEQ